MKYERKVFIAILIVLLLLIVSWSAIGTRYITNTYDSSLYANKWNATTSHLNDSRATWNQTKNSVTNYQLAWNRTFAAKWNLTTLSFNNSRAWWATWNSTTGHTYPGKWNGTTTQFNDSKSFWAGWNASSGGGGGNYSYVPATVTIYKNNSNYYAQGGRNGTIISASSNFSTVLQAASNWIKDGGTIYVKSPATGSDIIVPTTVNFTNKAITLTSDGATLNFSAINKTVLKFERTAGPYGQVCEISNFRISGRLLYANQVFALFNNMSARVHDISCTTPDRIYRFVSLYGACWGSSITHNDIIAYNPVLLWGYGNDVFSNCNGTVVSDNYFNCMYDNILVRYNYGVYSQGSPRITIADNTFQQSTHAVYASSNEDDYWRVTGNYFVGGLLSVYVNGDFCLVSNNHIQPSFANCVGVTVQGTYSTVISGNSFMSINNHDCHYINLVAGTRKVSITGNNFWESTAPINCYGVYCSGAAQEISIVGNAFVASDSGTSIPAYIATPTKCSFIGNTIHYWAATVSFATSTGCVVQGNVGYPTLFSPINITSANTGFAWFDSSVNLLKVKRAGGNWVFFNPNASVSITAADRNSWNVTNNSVERFQSQWNTSGAADGAGSITSADRAKWNATNGTVQRYQSTWNATKSKLNTYGLTWNMTTQHLNLFGVLWNASRSGLFGWGHNWNQTTVSLNNSKSYWLVWNNTKTLLVGFGHNWNNTMQKLNNSQSFWTKWNVTNSSVQRFQSQWNDTTSGDFAPNVTYITNSNGYKYPLTEIGLKQSIDNLGNSSGWVDGNYNNITITTPVKLGTSCELMRISLYLETNANCSMIRNYDYTNGNDNIYVHDVYLNGNSLNQPRQNSSFIMYDQAVGMWFVKCDNSTIRDCTVYNTLFQACGFQQSRANVIDNVKAYHIGQKWINAWITGSFDPGDCYSAGGIFLYNCSAGIITNCITNHTWSTGISVEGYLPTPPYWRSKLSVVSNCIVENTTIGIYIGEDCSNVTISDCVIRDITLYNSEFSLAWAFGSSGITSDGLIISNCVIDKCKNGIGLASTNTTIDNCKLSRITRYAFELSGEDLKVINNEIIRTGTIAMYFSGVKRAFISGNTIFGGCAWSYAIRLSSCHNCIVSGNIIYQSSANTPDYGIFESSSDSNIIEGNNVNLTTATSKITVTGKNTIVRNNYGYRTESWGTFSIASGASRGTVNTNMSCLPNTVIITPMGNTTCVNGMEGWNATYTGTGGTYVVRIMTRGNLANACTFSWYVSNVTGGTRHNN